MDQRSCSVCGRQVHKKSLARHMQRVHSVPRFPCTRCVYSGKSRADLDYHIARVHAPVPVNYGHECAICHEVFVNQYKLNEHKFTAHGTSSTARNNLDIDLSSFSTDSAAQEELRSYTHLLVDKTSRTKRQVIVNFPLFEFNTAEIGTRVDHLFDSLTTAAKINVSLGYLLINIETEEFRYFYAEKNNPLLDQPVVVENSGDLASLKSQLDGVNFIESVTSQHPDTKWKFYRLTNVSIIATLIHGVPMGCSGIILPDYLTTNPHITTLTQDANRHPINDNFCIFRALALHKSAGTVLSAEVEHETRRMAEVCIARMNKNIANFAGVEDRDVEIVEFEAEVNIKIFDISQEEGQLVGTIARRSAGLYPDSVPLLRYGTHLCYVKDLRTVFHTYRCTSCDTFFNRPAWLERHQKTCTGAVKHKFPGNFYQLRSTVFEELESIGIEVPHNLRFYSHAAVFDFESYVVASEDLINTRLTEWKGVHVPICVSVASDILEETIFLCNEDPKQLVVEFVQALEELAVQAEADMREKMLPYLRDVENMIGGEAAVSENVENQPDELPDEDKYEKLRIAQLKQIRKQFLRYISQFPVFGYNSGRYDLNLIKTYLIPHLVRQGVKIETTKKTNNFVSLQFNNIQFLDIINFLGGGGTLDSFLKAYGASETKGFFPYDYLTGYEVLSETSLPPYSAFFNSLKNCNSLETEHARYEKLLQIHPPEVVLKKMRLLQPPPTGAQNYEFLQQLWVDKGMNTFKDFLQWYCNKDVEPTLEALQKMMEFYHSRDVDMVKRASTLPGLANIMLHESTPALISLFLTKDKDLEFLLRQKIVGGASIIFTRYHKVGETKIRFSDNLVSTIIGVDASQLYPFSMSQPMPVGIYTRWKKGQNDKFLRTSTGRLSFEHRAISWYQHTHPECSVIATTTVGYQKKVGPYSVDGFCAHCNTVLEANGCYYHCHEKCRKFETDEEQAQALKRQAYDAERKRYLESCGYTVITCWECEFWRAVKNNGPLHGYMLREFPYIPPMGEKTLLEKVETGAFFGLLQCSVRVPDHLKSHFADFPPLFKNVDVSRSDIGAHMREVAESNELMKKPQRMTISSYFEEDGLFITPLLQFYMEQGLEVSQLLAMVIFFSVNHFDMYLGIQRETGGTVGVVKLFCTLRSDGCRRTQRRRS